MPNLLQQGAAWLAEQLKTHASTQVVYQRGSDQVALDATIGKTEFEIDDGAGVIQRFQSRDYLVQAVDLVLSGAITLPVEGDRIIETVAGQPAVYEVLAVGGSPAWQYSDPYRTLLRVHTKHVGVPGSSSSSPSSSSSSPSS